jgi:hypothetical protein
VFWANVHGTVLLGSALVVAYCCWRALARDRALHLAAALAAGASVLCTPYGLDIVHYYTTFVGNSAIRRFSSEWQPATHFWGLPAIPFFLLVAALLYVLVRNGVTSRPLLVAVTALVGLGFAGFRWQCWAGVVAVVLATDVLNEAQPPSAAERARGPRRFEVGLGLLAVPALVALLVQSTAGFEGKVPRDAIAAVARYPRATVLADDVTATPLLWLQPRFAGRLGIDDRLEVFTEAQVDDWADYVDGKEGIVARLTRSYDVLVASHDHEKLVKRLRALPGRRVVYDRHDGIVLVSTGNTPGGWSTYP